MTIKFHYLKMMCNILMMERTLQSCSDCVFCIPHCDGYDEWSYICNLGLDDIFHDRNDTIYDRRYNYLGCVIINKHPNVPCKACYDTDEIRTILGV